MYDGASFGVRLDPALTVGEELCFEVQALPGLGHPLLPLGADQSLLVAIQGVVGVAAGEDPREVAMADALGRLELAPDAGPSG